MRPLSVPWTLVTVVLEPTRCFSGPRADVLLTALARLSLNTAVGGIIFPLIFIHVDLLFSSSSLPKLQQTME